MATVYNWQIGREMEYPYEGKRPEKGGNLMHHILMYRFLPQYIYF